MQQERKIDGLGMRGSWAVKRRRRDVPCGERARFQWPRYVLAGLLVTVGSLWCLSAESAHTEEQGVAERGRVVAKVNGKPIYAEQLQPAVEKRLRTFRKFGARKKDPDLVKRLERRALDQIIGTELIHQESQKLTIEGMDEKVEQKVKALEKKFGAGKGMKFYLKRRKITMDDLRKSLRTRVRLDEYLKQHGILDPDIPEDRIRKMYEEDPKSFSRKKGTIDVSHVLISVAPDAGTKEKEEAKQRAEQIREKILGGKGFAEMAREHSDCNSASGGGRLGSIERGFMPKEFDEVAFALEKGAASEIVETRFGYHIIRILDKKPAGLRPYEEVRDFIRKYLQEQESKVKLAAHIAELKEESKIEIVLK